MGVDITAYSRLELTEPHDFTDDCYDANHHQAYAYPEHVDSFEGLLDGRCYAETEATVGHKVMSMSYGGYNRWREFVCRAAFGVGCDQVWADLDAYRGQPFYYVIHFADNEGCIGPSAAARLAEGFVDPAARERFDSLIADADQVHRDFWTKAWDGFAEGSRLTADGGMVSYS